MFEIDSINDILVTKQINILMANQISFKCPSSYSYWLAQFRLKKKQFWILATFERKLANFLVIFRKPGIVMNHGGYKQNLVS